MINNREDLAFIFYFLLLSSWILSEIFWTFSCSINKLCFRCNKPGHESRNCERKNIKKVCSMCGHANHRSINCLLSQKILYKTEMKKAKFMFCGKEGHFNCKPFPKANEKNVYVNWNESLLKDNNEILKNGNLAIKVIEETKAVNSINSTNHLLQSFCHFCGENHDSKKCKWDIDDIDLLRMRLLRDLRYSNSPSPEIRKHKHHHT